MKKRRLTFISAILLFIAAIYLASTPAYTSVKGFVVDLGGSIGLAVAVAMGLVVLVFASGAVVLRRA